MARRRWNHKAVAVAGMLVLVLQAAAQVPVEWRTGFGTPGLSMQGTGFVAATIDLGSGPEVYIGGFFGAAETIAAEGLLRRVGDSWQPVRPGMATLPISVNGNIINVAAVAGFDDGQGKKLYVADGSVYRADGTTWTPLLSATTGISPIVINDIIGWNDGSGDALFAGGRFHGPSGFFEGVAKWTGQDWVIVGSAFVTLDASGALRVDSLEVFTGTNGQTYLYAAGQFSTIGTTSARGIARWNGTAWSQAGAGVFLSPTSSESGLIRDLCVHNDGSGPKLYAVGDFSKAGTTVVENIARWNGSSWSSIGGVDTAYSINCVTSATINGVPTLFVGGSDFFSVAGVAVTNVAAYAQGAWSSPGNGITQQPQFFAHINALTSITTPAGTRVIACGFFDAAEGRYVSEFDGTQWAPLPAPPGLKGIPQKPWPAGINNQTSAWADVACEFDDGSGKALYVGGEFQTIGGVAANRIAKFDGQSWQAVSIGFNAKVSAMAVFDDGSGPKLYIGGSFTTADGQVANKLARWDGTSLSPVPGWITSLDVEDLAVYDDGYGPALWVATRGNTYGTAIWKYSAAGVQPSYLWFNLTCGSTGISDLLVADLGQGPVLVACGQPIYAGNGPCSGVFSWNGTSIETFAGGLDFVAGTNGGVRALTAYTTVSGAKHLIACGDVTGIVATGQSASVVVEWDGVQWTQIGSEPNFPDIHRALHTFRDGLFDSVYLGGFFKSISGVSSSSLARYDGFGWWGVDGGVRFVGEQLNAEVRGFVEYDFGDGPELCLLGAFNVAGEETASAGIAFLKPKRPSIAIQQNGPGQMVTVECSALIPGVEYFNLFSLEPSPAGAGTGPYLGLTFSDPTVLFDQLFLPAGTLPWHYVATDATATFGPYAAIPGITVEAVSFGFFGFISGIPSSPVRVTIQ